MHTGDVRCIGIDWGTSRFRAYGLSASGTILKRHVSDAGVAMVADSSAGSQAFESVFVRELGSWLEAHPTANVIASGMAGSRLGWVETRYLPCPVDLSSIASALERRSIGGRTIAFTPGLTRIAQDGMPDVMRGEEVQVFGSLSQLGDGWYVVPGTHSKWVLLAGGQIVWFASFMSGELFDVLVQHTVLTQAGSPGAPAESSDGDAFCRGLDYARASDAESGGFLKRLFSTRSLVARGELSGSQAREYLSGLIIGGELREALTSMPGATPARVTLIASAELSGRYVTALQRAGIAAAEGPADAAANGHFAIARQAGLV
jgi:2-dehydro-3-deoxygalactonokinase